MRVNTQRAGDFLQEISIEGSATAHKPAVFQKPTVAPAVAAAGPINPNDVSKKAEHPPRATAGSGEAGKVVEGPDRSRDSVAGRSTKVPLPIPR